MPTRQDIGLNAKLFLDPKVPSEIARPVIQAWLEGRDTVQISGLTGFMEWRVANIVAAFQDRCHQYLSSVRA